jgi:hypothetical protein
MIREEVQGAPTEDRFLTEGGLIRMSPHEFDRIRTPVLLPALALGIVVMTGLASFRSAAAEGDKGAGLSVAEFQELKPILDIQNQPWTTIPWKYSITEARKLAAATHKPIFMVVNTGNCLGCT